MPNTVVDVSGLSHQYDSKSKNPILNNLSLSLTEGETLALVGASGSGKSTLLNLIGGLEPVQTGTVRVFDHTLHDANNALRTHLRRNVIGFVYQAFNLIPTLSVMDNVRLPMALAGVNKKEQDNRVNALLTTVGLGDRKNAFPDALSGGEQQRVAIARAVVHRPALLLADEPTGNLDASTGQQVLTLLQSLVSEHNTTLLMVTHSLKVANCADSILTMNDGKLVEPQAAQPSMTTW